MKILNIKPLQPRVEKLETLLAQREETRAIDRECDKTIARIMEDGVIDDGEEERQLASARHTKEMLPNRLRQFDAAIAKSSSDLWVARTAIVTDWNRCVKSAGEALQKEISAKLEPYCDGDKRALRDNVDRLWIPRLNRIRRCTAGNEFFGSKPSPEQYLAATRSFIAFVEKNAEIIGVTIEA